MAYYLHLAPSSQCCSSSKFQFWTSKLATFLGPWQKLPAKHCRSLAAQTAESDAHVWIREPWNSNWKILKASVKCQVFSTLAETPTRLLSFLAQLPFHRHQPHLGHHCKDSYHRSLHQRDMLNVARPKLAPPPKVVLPAWKTGHPKMWDAPSKLMAYLKTVIGEWHKNSSCGVTQSYSSTHKKIWNRA